MIDSEMYSPTAKLIREGWWIKLCNLRRICLEEPTLEDHAIYSGPFGDTKDDVSGVWSLLRYDLDELGLWGWTTSYFRNTHAFHMKVHSYLLRKYKQRQTWNANKLDFSGRLPRPISKYVFQPDYDYAYPHGHGPPHSPAHGAASHVPHPHNDPHGSPALPL